MKHWLCKKIDGNNMGF